MKSRWVGLTASAALLGLMPGALNAAAPVLRDEAATSPAQKRAERLMADARGALSRGIPAEAVRQAEAAVLLRPNEADARALLGRAYLAAGRFQSADTALGDALTLDPSLGGAAVGRALAQIALGQVEAAQATLAGADGYAADADVGLALALLGRIDEAREKLLAASRLPGADARTRQNLALVYAFEGRWNDAAAIAAQDVPADLMADRLRRWAMVAQLRGNGAMQVGALLGTLPADDAGQPAQLALAVPPASVDAPVQVAEVEQPVPVVPYASAAVSPPALAPVAPAVQGGAIVTQTNFAPPSLDQLATLAVTPDIILPPREPVATEQAAPLKVQAWAGPPRSRGRAKIVEPTAAQPRVTPVKAMRPAHRPVAPAVVRTVRHERRLDGPMPKPLLLVSKVSLKPVAGGARGWSVQLGAFSSAQRTAVAWNRISSKVRFLNGHVPTGSSVQRGTTLFHRLSVGGIPTRIAAIRLCQRVQAAGVPCFVRPTGGDQPLTWALRARTEAAA